MTLTSSTTHKQKTEALRLVTPPAGQAAELGLKPRVRPSGVHTQTLGMSCPECLPRSDHRPAQGQSRVLVRAATAQPRDHSTKAMNSSVTRPPAAARLGCQPHTCGRLPSAPGPCLPSPARGGHGAIISSAPSAHSRCPQGGKHFSTADI